MISPFAMDSMQLQSLPLSLQTLALEEFVEHVINLWKKVDCYSSTRGCTRIKVVIHSGVSHVFADAVTNKLLEQVCRLSNYYVHSRLTRELLQAVIHPKVRELRLNFHDFYNISNDNVVNIGIAEFIWNDVINRLESLTKLYISDTINSFVPLKIPNHIMALDVPHCDRLLKVIADSCPMLKELHVRDFKPTPASLECLQSLQALEKLNIVNNTCRHRCYGMNMRQCYSFLRNLSKCLKTVSFSNLLASDINQFDTCPELSSLTLFGLGIDAVLSTQFSNLEDLHLWGAMIYQMPFTGNLGRLTTISMHVSVVGYMAHLALHCPLLENLTMKRITYFGPSEHFPVEFTSLKNVHFECNSFCSWCVLTNSINLRSLTLCYYRRGEQEKCQEKCLKKNQFPNLEVFNASNSLAYEALSGLMSVNPNIKIVKGVKRGSVMEDIKMIYPWVQFYS